MSGHKLRLGIIGLGRALTLMPPAFIASLSGVADEERGAAKRALADVERKIAGIVKAIEDGTYNSPRAVPDLIESEKDSLEGEFVIHVWTAPAGQGISTAIPLIESGSFMCTACCTRPQAAGHDDVGGSGPHQAAAL